MTGDAADRELLIEALAIHLGVVPPRALDDLEAARREAAASIAARPLAQTLVESSVLTAEQCALLETLADGLLERHGDARRSLDSLAAFGRLRAELERRWAAATGAGNPSNNPTLPSFPINGERSGPATADEGRDDSFLPGGVDPSVDERGPLDPGSVAGALGMPTSVGARFRILRPHAQGGIGKVSVAFDDELQREVALKQIKPERADDADSRARFLLEAEVTGRLEHPGIVPVYGLGLDDDGRPFYAMRFVRGTTLDEAINAFHGADEDPRRDPQERSLALRHLLERFVNVCQTIAYAHSEGVLHRDLKPANVLLGPFNESLVVDWGLAKELSREEEPSPMPRAAPSTRGLEAVDEAPAPESGSSPSSPGRSSSVETVAGTAFGTPAYMSPEQAEGQLDRIGPASDVYSLGAILYTLLVGRPPFDYIWCDVTAMLDRVRLGEFPRPRRANPRVPRALEAVCLRAMSTRPEDRYPSATELADEIERWLADEPVRADREPAVARMARWGRRHKPIVAGAAALLLTAVAALSAGIVLIGREQRNTEDQRRLAVERAEALRRRDAISRVNLAYREYLDDNVALGDELLDSYPIDLKAWEWSYARRLGHAELTSWTPSDKGLDVWSVAFSPDGARIAAGTGPWYMPGDDPTGELAVRDAHSRAEAFAVRGLKGAVQAVAFSPDGRTLAAAHGFTGRDAGAVLLMLDAGSGRELWRAEERGVQVLALAFAPDGRTLAAGCGRFNESDSVGHVRLLDAKTGGGTGRTIAGVPGGVLAMAFAPDGRTLALTGRDVVDLHDLSDPRRPLVGRLGGHVNFVYAVAFSPDGRRIASGGWDGMIRVWDRATGKATETLFGHRGFVRGLAFSPDGHQLVSSSEDRSVRRWDLDGGDHATFHGHTGFVHCAAFGPDGALTASGSQDGTVKVWPAAAPDSQVTFRNSAGWVGAVAFAPDGRTVATAHNGNVRIWDPHTGEERRRILARRGFMGNIALTFSPDGSTLAASGPDGDVILWDAGEWSRRGVLAGAPQVKDAAFAPDGRTLATVGNDGLVRLWDVAGRRPRWVAPFHEGGDDAVAFAPDGRTLATAGVDRIVRVWDATTGATLAHLSGHREGVRDVAYSPDGRRLVSVGGAYRGPDPDEIKVWDLATRREVRTSFRGHTGLVTAVSYFDGGRRLATASDDRTIKLWDPRTGENVLTLRGHTSGVVGMAVSPDGRQIASGSIDHSARIWSIDSQEGEAAFDLSLRRAAVERVQGLFAHHLLKEDVLAALRRDPNLSPRLREAALEIAGRRTENASRLYDAAWLTIARPIGSPEDNLLALRRLEAACRVVADDPERLAEYRHALALAYYRVDRPSRALEVVAELARRGPPWPVDLAVVAMASHRLGREADARRATDQLRTLVESGHWPGPRDAVSFLEEVEGALKPR